MRSLRAGRTRRRSLAVTRRTAVVAGASLFAGCAAVARKVAHPNRRYVVDRTVSVPAGEFRRWAFELGREREVEFGASVASGPAVDVYLLTAAAFENYRAGEAFDARYTSGLGVTDGFAEDTLPAGAYVVVLDNTGRGEGPGDADVRADVRVVVG